MWPDFAKALSASNRRVESSDGVCAARKVRIARLDGVLPALVFSLDTSICLQ